MNFPGESPPDNSEKYIFDKKNGRTGLFASICEALFENESASQDFRFDPSRGFIFPTKHS
ncbi:hypothetical protein DLM78_07810 [Leptospira stimsonii]|uniref:Uncharacterized protein n=1 Tax=Leptospira stimsonii TaxID=2202203 RepID=A0A8B3CVV6_9LEPT|nr:hypothetical protein DLM78_07810 [Leptospira stimsonii]